MSTRDDKPHFLARWSDRKRAVAEADELEAAAPAVEDGDAEHGALEEVKDPDAITPEELEALEQIDIESLDYEADFTPFMKKGVPDLMRQAALRQLWRSNPILANLDGMNDYDENFHLAHKVLENIQTAYKVGEGYLTKAERAAMAGETLEEEVTDEVVSNTLGEDADIEKAEVAELSNEPNDQVGDTLKDKRDISDHTNGRGARDGIVDGVDDLDDEEFA